LSATGNTGNIIIGKFTTAGIVKNSATGVLSSGSVNLASAEVSGVLPIANGGTNATTLGAAGTIIYSDGTKYASTPVGTTGQILQSNATGQPTWTNIGSLVKAGNGVRNQGDSILLGGALTQNTSIPFSSKDLTLGASGDAGNIAIGKFTTAGRS